MSAELTWRALTRADIPALADLLADSERVDVTREHYDRLELAEEFAEESLDLARDTVGVQDDDRLVGMGMLRRRGLVHGSFVLELWGTVHPERRGEGIGRGILAVQLHRAAALHADQQPAVPTRVVVRPYDHCRSHVQLVRAVGLEPVRHWFDMERDLTDPLPEIPAVPPEIEIVDYHADRDEQVREVYNAAFAESFGAVDQDPEAWAAWFTGSRAFRPDLSTVALHDGRVIGFCLSYFYVADAAADGVAEGWIGQVGTLDEYRRRGVGTHLIARALHAHRAAGFQRAALDVDGESDIGGLAIYSRLGFRVARKRTSFVRVLPPG